MVKIIIGLIASYLIGSIPTAYIFGRLFKGIDIRKSGSGNVGATNAFRVLGKPIGICVLLIDILKGFAAVILIGSKIMPESSIFKLAVFLVAFAGHNWTIFLNFKGGKGMAVSLGGLAGLALAIVNLRIPLILAVVVWLVVFFISRYVSLASIISSLSLPLLLIIFKAPIELTICGAIISILIIYKHKSNIIRLLEGKELSINNLPK